MPELPEVETVCQGLMPFMQGMRLESVVLNRPDLRFPLPEFFAERLSGRRVMTLTRRAKYILATLDDGWVWLTHLGMSGKFRINPDTKGRHDHLVFQTSKPASLAFHDPRRFGFMDLVTAADAHRHPALSRLGVEPLSAAFSPALLQTALKGKSAPIKSLLLSQGIVAGLGNIYVSESLHRAFIHPERAGESLTMPEHDALVAAIKAVLTEAIQAGGSTLRDYSNPTGELGCFQHQFTVYQREGQPCHRDQTPIIRRVHAGRSTFFCPTCQQ